MTLNKYGFRNNALRSAVRIVITIPPETECQ